jgi:hypothetical protein
MNELLANFDINGVWIISSFPEKGVMSNCLRFRLVFFLIFCHSAILFGQSYNGNYTKVTGGNWNAGSTWILGSAPAPFSGTTAQPVYIKNNINLNIDELLINEGVYVIGSFGDNKITGGVYNYFKPSGGSNTFFDSRIYYCQDPSKNNCTATLPSGILSGDVLQYNGNLQSVGSFDQTTDPNNKFYNACPVSNFYTAKSNTGENDFSKTWTVNESVTTTKSAIPLPSAGSNAFTYPSIGYPLLQILPVNLSF